MDRSLAHMHFIIGYYITEWSPWTDQSNAGCYVWTPPLVGRAAAGWVEQKQGWASPKVTELLRSEEDAEVRRCYEPQTSVSTWTSQQTVERNQPCLSWFLRSPSPSPPLAPPPSHSLCLRGVLEFVPVRGQRRNDQRFSSFNRVVKACS